MRNKVNRLEEMFMRLVENRSAMSTAKPLPLATIRAVGFNTIVIREFGRIIRIWGQTIVPSAVTATLYFVIFGSLIGRRVGEMGGFDYMQLHRARPDHDVGDHQLLRQRGVVVLRRQVRQAHRGAAGLAAAQLADRGRLRLRRPGARPAGGAGGHRRVAVLHAPARASSVAHHHRRGAADLARCSRSAGFINAVFAKNFDQVNWIPAFVLTPLTYFGGVFYSVNLLPEWAQKLSIANPILYMVNAFRYGFLGTSDVSVPGAFAIMIVLVVVLFTWALVLLNRGTGIRD